MEFLKNNKRFSFKLDEKNVWELPFKTQTSEDGGKLIQVYDFEDGLRVTNISLKHKNGAYEWVNYFENTGSTPTGIISDLWDCDCSLSFTHEDPYNVTAYFPDVNKATKIYSPIGSTWRMDEFYCDVDKIIEKRRINHIYPGEEKDYSALHGRSSEETAPFFNVYKENAGYVFAIGWTGQWGCKIGRSEDSIEFKSHIQDTKFRVLPGEKFRTSSIVIMPYEGDFIDGQNKWRRLVKEDFSPIGKGLQDKYLPLSAGIWGGMKSSSVLKRIEKIKEEQLPFEYIWMDAGWYGEGTEATPDEFDGGWWHRAGDWRVSKKIHPDGLADVTEAIHNAGMKFLLWFEPERAMKDVPVVNEHPDWFLPSSLTNNTFVWNLGNDDAREYCFNTLSEVIEKLDINCYRQDFNTAPITFWQENDAEDRCGITQIKHINGMYKLWDALLEKFPGLLIDDCAGGGRRIDIETLRRSAPLWRSDYQCSANYDPESAQCHNITYNSWMPYSGTCTGRIYNEYNIRSSYAGGLRAAFSFSEREEFADTKEKVEFLKKYMAEYLKVRPYFSEDFYPLTSFNTNLDVWCAMQFNRPEKEDGIILVFRRENSPYDSASFVLRGIDAACNYSIEDADGGNMVISGKELSEKGFTVDNIEKRAAKIYFYKKV